MMNQHILSSTQLDSRFSARGQKIGGGVIEDEGLIPEHTNEWLHQHARPKFRPIQLNHMGNLLSAKGNFRLCQRPLTRLRTLAHLQGAQKCREALFFFLR